MYLMWSQDVKLSLLSGCYSISCGDSVDPSGNWNTVKTRD